MRPAFSKTLRALSFVSLGIAPTHAVDFYKDVFPFLESNCIACHNKTTSKGGLNMESPADIRKDGDSGPGVIPGKSAESLVVKSASHQGDAVMPPKNNKSGARDLTPSEIKILATWIDEGAKDSAKPSREIAWKPIPAGVSPIYSVAVSPDGRFSLCSRGNRLFAYDTATRQELAAPMDANAGVPNAAHRSFIQSIAFSPDGTSLVTTSFREIKVWRREQSTPLALPKPPTPHATLLNASPRLVAVKPDNTPIILEPAERALGPALSAQPRSIHPAPDDSAVAFLLDNGQIEIRDLRNGTSLPISPNETKPVLATWTGDAAAFITSDSEGKLALHQVKTPASGSTIPSLAIPGGVVAMGPANGAHFAVLAKDSTLRLHSLAKAEAVASIKTPNALQFVIAANGSRAALALDSGRIRIIELPSGKQLTELAGDSETTTKLESLERTIARSTLEIAFQKSVLTKLENEIKDFDNHTKRTTDLIATARKTLPEREKAVMPAKEAFVAAEKELAEAEAALKAAPTGKPDATLTSKRRDALNKTDTTKKAFISAETLVANSNNQITDGEAHLARIEEGRKRNGADAAAAKEIIQRSESSQADATKQIAAIKEAAGKAHPPATRLAFGQSEATLHAVDANGRLNTWAIASGRPLVTRTPNAPSAPIGLQVLNGTATCILANGTTLHGEPIVTWKLARTIGSATAASPFNGRVNAARFSPDGKMIATGSGEFSRSGDIHLWETASGKQLAAWKERHRDAVLAVDFSPDGKLLVSGGADRLAKVTEIATGKHVYLFEAHTHQVTAVAFRIDGRIVATGGADGVVNVWDMALGERKKKLTSWKKEITSLQFLGETNQILTSSGDNQVRIVGDDGSEVRSITNLPDFMQAAAASSPTGTIVGGGEDSALRFWDASNGKELATFNPQQTQTLQKP